MPDRSEAPTGHAALELTADPGELSLSVPIRRCYSAGLLQAGQSFAGPLSVTNYGHTSQGPRSARLAAVDIGLDWRYEIPAIGPGESCTVPPADDWLDQDELERIVAPREITTTLSLQGQRSSIQAWLLNAWQWPLVRSARVALGAYVMPNDGIVRRISAAVRDPVSRGSDSGSLAGDAVGGRLTPPGRPRPVLTRSTRAQAWIRALFEHVQETFALTYAQALPVELPSGDRYQPVRPPHRTLHFGDPLGGEGTCLDLTILLAACAEGAGLSPLIILLGPDETTLTHALLGIWLGGGTRPRPLIPSSDPLVEDHARGRLLVLEATALCQGPRGQKYPQALAWGRAQLEAYPHVEAVDVRALRPPRGRVLPIETPMEAAVLEALAIAAQIAQKTDAPLFETLHLLYGLVCTQGDLTQRLLASVDSPSHRLESLIEAELQGRQDSARPGRTIGYDRCLADAHEAARSQSSTVVREGDLWWAILWGRSRAVKKVLHRAGLSWSLLEDALTGLLPPERLHTRVDDEGDPPTRTEP